MRRLFVAGNWKMNTDRAQAGELARGAVEAAGQAEAVDVAVCPPFPYLGTVADALAGSTVGLGAQNMYFEPDGAFTGEVAGAMLLDVGCRYVILGHSERRWVLGEDDALVNRKLTAALQVGLDPIVCIGELIEQREAGQTHDVLRSQIQGSLAGLTPDQLGKLVIAYEPVWAIGTGKTATADIAQETHGFVRGLLTGLAGRDVAETIRIQYGGSVKPDNAAELMQQPDIDGALVGGASLKADSFSGIIAAAATVS